MCREKVPINSQKAGGSRGNAQSRKNPTKKSVLENPEERKGDLPLASEPKMAIKVLDPNDLGIKPIKEALFAEHLFRKTIESSIPVGIAGFDTQGRQIYVNRVFCEMVGWAEKDLLDTPFPQPYWTSGSSRRQTDAASKVFDRILRGVSFEIQFHRQSGERFWGLVSSALLRDRNGTDVGRLISVADIDAQKQAEKALRRLSTRLIGVREEERKLISQDLHDSIGGKLTGIKYSLEKIISELDPASEKMAQALAETVDAVRSTIEEAQRITKHLHPSILDDLGLLAAVRGYCREFQQVYAAVHLETVLELEEEAVPGSVKILVYRVLQEAMNNIAKHSKAGAVSVVLKGYRRKIELRVEDDGAGFDAAAAAGPSTAESGMGLESMKDRTELFGGRLEIRSKKGEGTTIKASWPLPA